MLGSSHGDIVIRRVEAGSNSEYSVNAYPTLVYRDGKGLEEVYSGSRDIQSLKQFLDSK